MGRKRSANGDNKIYFSVNEEQAFREYLNETDPILKNEIYEKRLHPAFVKLIECVIKRYKLFLPDEEFRETSEDCMSFIMTKFDMFKPNKKSKAYSYFGTCAKHYVIYRLKKYHDNLLNNDRYDNDPNYYEESERYADEEYSLEQDAYLQNLLDSFKNRVNAMIKHKSMFELSENEELLGVTILELLENWEMLFDEVEKTSKKFNKESVFYYLREMTLMENKDIRKYIKKYINAYNKIKEDLKVVE